MRSIFAGSRVEAFKELEKKTEVVKVISTKNSKLMSYIQKKKNTLKKLKLLMIKIKLNASKLLKNLMQIYFYQQDFHL